MPNNLPEIGVKHIVLRADDLSKKQKDILEKAKDELRKLYNRD